MSGFKTNIGYFRNFMLRYCTSLRTYKLKNENVFIVCKKYSVYTYTCVCTYVFMYILR